MKDDFIELRFNLSFADLDHAVFQANLCSGLMKLGARAEALESLSVRLRAGSVLTELRGSAALMKLLRSLPLDQLEVLGVRAEIVKAAEPPDEESGDPPTPPPPLPGHARRMGAGEEDHQEGGAAKSTPPPAWLEELRDTPEKPSLPPALPELRGHKSARIDDEDGPPPVPGNAPAFAGGEAHDDGYAKSVRSPAEDFLVTLEADLDDTTRPKKLDVAAGLDEARREEGDRDDFLELCSELLEGGEATAVAPKQRGPAVLERPKQKKVQRHAEDFLKSYERLGLSGIEQMELSPRLIRRLKESASAPSLPGMDPQKAALETKRALRLVYHRVTSPPPVYRQYQRTAMEDDLEDVMPHDNPVAQVKRMQRRRSIYNALPVSQSTGFQSWPTGPCSSPRTKQRRAPTATGGKAGQAPRGLLKGPAPGGIREVTARPTDLAATAMANAAAALRDSHAALVAEQQQKQFQQSPPRTPPTLGPLRKSSSTPLLLPAGPAGAAMAAAAKRSLFAGAGASTMTVVTPPGSSQQRGGRAATMAPGRIRARPSQHKSGSDMLKMLQSGASPSLLCPPV